MKTGTTTVNGRELLVVVAEAGERWTQVTCALGLDVRSMDPGKVHISQIDGEDYRSVAEYIAAHPGEAAAIPGLSDMDVRAIVAIG